MAYSNDLPPEQRHVKNFQSTKIAKKLKKHLQSLARHDPEVVVSEIPTQILFVANSSVLCGVSLEELEKIFLVYDELCSFVVYRDRRPYSFVQFSSHELAAKALENLHGKIPGTLQREALPFYVAFVKNVPSVLKVKPQFPNGLRILKDFVDINEETSLMGFLETCSDIKKKLKSRSVVHFGYKFDYSKNDATVPAEKPIPLCCNFLIERMMEQGVFKKRPDQLTVNIYEPGDGIPSHVDVHSPFEETIVALSLKSDIVMEFRDVANTTFLNEALLPRLSLLVMQGEARYRWKHGIAKRKYDVNPENHRLIKRQLRVSFTFRNVATQKCQCSFIEYCDWDRNGAMRIPQDCKHGKAIENHYVASVYESIADHFDMTRQSQWVAVKDFLSNLSADTLLYDVGSGNGKYLMPQDGIVKIGCDFSEKLCLISRKKNCEVIRADVLNLPFKNDSADAILSVAVIHHISTQSRRMDAVREILRCLRSGGRACITVWSFEQAKGDMVSQYLKMRNNKKRVPGNRRDSNGRLRVHEGKDFTQQDMLVPWQNCNGEHFLRYYHLFVVGELEELVRKVGYCDIEKASYEEGNWIIIIKKQ